MIDFREKGYTLIELLVIIAIFFILLMISAYGFASFRDETPLNNSAEEVMSVLRTAKNKALASEGGSRWGVCFDVSASPNVYTLFKGDDYASRDTAFDIVREIPVSIEIYSLNLGGGSEAVFSQVTGNTGQSGNISLRIKNDTSKTKNIVVNPSGQVTLGGEQAITDANRIKDSRHIHFIYTRTISTSTESLVLTFDGSVTESVSVADNMDDDQIFWKESVDVGGEMQSVKIHTHRLNDTDTLFCVHRDLMHNTKSLKIDIDGSPDLDPGTLIEYTADGSTVSGTSVFVLDLNYEWQ